MTTDELTKMAACRHLLPDPGPEVVAQLLSEIERLNARAGRLEKGLTETVFAGKSAQELIRLLHMASLDWAEDHTHMEEACKKFLPADKLDGKGYFMGIMDLADLLVVEIERLTKIEAAAMAFVIRFQDPGTFEYDLAAINLRDALKGAKE